VTTIATSKPTQKSSTLARRMRATLPIGNTRLKVGVARADAPSENPT
jgi:hypothetical protein